MLDLESKYKNEAAAALKNEFGYKNYLEIPRVEKVVVAIGLGEAVENPKAVEAASSQLAAITGQKPAIAKAKKAVSAFKLRKGAPVGLKVTLRKKRMYHFLDKLFRVVLPRIRDFRGVNEKNFDNSGNLNLGFAEQTIFGEIEYAAIDKVRGLQVTIVTTAKTQPESKRLLELLGMPFKKGDN